LLTHPVYSGKVEYRDTVYFGEHPAIIDPEVWEAVQAGFDADAPHGGRGDAASTKVRAAECILNHAAKAIELEDIEARVTDLERAAEAAKNITR
jgi:hypothetical protein